MTILEGLGGVAFFGGSVSLRVGLFGGGAV